MRSGTDRRGQLGIDQSRIPCCNSRRNNSRLSRQLASELGALSKFGKRREFGPSRSGKPKWPIEWRKVSNRFSYRMSADMAELWNK